jgi:hypothetical protein
MTPCPVHEAMKGAGKYGILWRIGLTSDACLIY